jgi:hypothetical protein
MGNSSLPPNCDEKNIEAVLREVDVLSEQLCSVLRGFDPNVKAAALALGRLMAQVLFADVDRIGMPEAETVDYVRELMGALTDAILRAEVDARQKTKKVDMAEAEAERQRLLTAAA